MRTFFFVPFFLLVFVVCRPPADRAVEIEERGEEQATRFERALLRLFSSILSLFSRFDANGCDCWNGKGGI